MSQTEQMWTLIAAGILIGVGEYILLKISKPRKSKFSIEFDKDENYQLSKMLADIDDPNKNSLVTDLFPKLQEMGNCIKCDTIREMFLVTRDLSEDSADTITDEYGDRLNENTRRRLNYRLKEFVEAYKTGEKFLIYDSLCLMFHDLSTHKEKEDFPRESFLNEFREAISSLEKGKLDRFYGVLSNYSQQPFDDPIALLYINFLNDTLNSLRHGSSYQELKNFYTKAAPILRDMEVALSQNNREKIYQSYESLYKLLLTIPPIDGQ